MHELNGALHGVSMSSELLARSAAVMAAGHADGAALAARSRTEMKHLKEALKAFEHRLSPSTQARRHSSAPALQTVWEDAETCLRPAFRRGQHVLNRTLQPEEILLDIRQDELFDLLTGLILVVLGSSAEGSALNLSIAADSDTAIVGMTCSGATRSALSVELHREVMRCAVESLGGRVVWQESEVERKAQLTLPRSAVPG